MSTNTNDTNNTSAVKVFEADEVEIHRPDGHPIPTTITVKGKPGAVNFIEKITDPYVTYAKCQVGGGNKVVNAQYAYHEKMFTGFDHIVLVKSVPVHPGSDQRHIYTAIRSSVPLKDEIVDDHSEANNPRASCRDFVTPSASTPDHDGSPGL